MEKRIMGCLILNDYKELDHYKKGRKEKHWLEKDGVKYLFKTGASNYEVWAELFASEIGKQCGFNVAEYDLAFYQGQYGVVTKSFLKNNELIISGESIIKFYKTITLENNMTDEIGNYNSIENILMAMGLFCGLNNCIDVLDDLVKMWCFDGLLMESDRNETNWSIIQNGNQYRLAPIYDCSTMARMNNNIRDLLNGTRSYGDIARMIDNITYQLTFHKDDETNTFLPYFEEFCRKYAEKSDEIMKAFQKIDISKAIETIENRINTGITDEQRIEFPWEAHIWLEKTINFRLNDMISIHNNSKNKRKTL